LSASLWSSVRCAPLQSDDDENGSRTQKQRRDARQTRRRLSVAGRRGTRTVPEESVLRPNRKEQRHRGRATAVRGQQQRHRHQQRKVPRVRGRHQSGAEAPGQDGLLQNGTGRGRGRAAHVRRPVRRAGRADLLVAVTAAPLPHLPEGRLSPSFGRGEFSNVDNVVITMLIKKKKNTCSDFDTVECNSALSTAIRLCPISGA